MLEGTGAGELPTLPGEADPLARQGRRADCAEAESGPSGDPRPGTVTGDVRYEIELRLTTGAFRGSAFEYVAEVLVEALRRPGIGERLRSGAAGDAELGD